MGVVFSPSSNSFHRKARGKGGGVSILSSVYGVFRLSGPRGQILGRKRDKSLRSFSPCYSPNWLWLDKVILEIIKPHYSVLSSSRGIGIIKKKKFLMAGHLLFNSGSNESSLAPQFKWLDNTFKLALTPVPDLWIRLLYVPFESLSVKHLTDIKYTGYECVLIGKKCVLPLEIGD
jgi:hypothetical protein